MPIEIVFGDSGEFQGPAFVCDECGERILEAGTALFPVGARGPGVQAFFTHTTCAIAFRTAMLGIPAQHWGSMALGLFLIQLCRNAEFDFGAIHTLAEVARNEAARREVGLVESRRSQG